MKTRTRAILERKGAKIATYSILVIACFITLFPLIWIFLSSIKPPPLVSKPDVLLFEPSLTNWVSVLFRSTFLNALSNSILVATFAVLFSLVIGLPAAYSIARYHTGGLKINLVILSSAIIPPVAIMIPFFMIMYYLKLLDTLPAVTLAHITFTLPYVVFFLTSFIAELPKELEEQAMVDGCSRFQAMTKIVIPNIKPGIAASCIFTFAMSWNDFPYALILTGGNAKTLPVFISGYWTFRGIQMGEMSVAVLVAIIPVLICIFFIQKHIVKGLTAGAVKF